MYLCDGKLKLYTHLNLTMVPIHSLAGLHTIFTDWYNLQTNYIYHRHVLQYLLVGILFLSTTLAMPECLMRGAHVPCQFEDWIHRKMWLLVIKPGQCRCVCVWVYECVYICVFPCVTIRLRVRFIVEFSYVFSSTDNPKYSCWITKTKQILNP